MTAVALTLSKARSCLVLAALLAILALLCAPAMAQDQGTAQDRGVDIDVFYEQLAPYGQWFEHPVWGTVWRPRVDQDWRPYAQGAWVYTDDFGWYWEAEEPWGWAPFHYGRWLIDEDGSWIWIPDTEWGPAWVAWRTSEEYVGWAPLPPDARWGPDGELIFDAEFYSAPRYHLAWCFVRPHQLILPGLHRYLLPRRYASSIYRQSRPLRAHQRVEGRFIHAGFDVRRFERMTGRPVVRVRLKSVDNPQAVSALRGSQRGAELSTFKPRFIDRPEGSGRIHRPAAADPGRFDARGPSAEREQRWRGGPGGALPPPAATLGRPNTEPSSGPTGNAEPTPPGARVLNRDTRERRPDFGPRDSGTTQRPRSPTTPYGEADPGRGPPPGLQQRPYGAPPGTPRAYSAPQPTARPIPPATGQVAPPTNLRAPPPGPLPPARSGPGPGEERRAPQRKDENKGPG
ncbi:MAG TPA: DUF6600 domain-containing protein [Hyphomicrobiaceae bacterium]|nr:DUF6600 domain-containing protein [Hyphomicrobiaceae bacterium]